MTSTVLDAVCCLLLVSAAAVTVGTAPAAPAPAGESTRADDVATTLATTTATVNYSLAPADGGSRDVDAAAFERTTSGSLATLLAQATVRSVRLHGDPLAHTADDFREQVRAATLETLPTETQVVVRWQPYPGSHIGRTLTVGPDPPPESTVHAATTRVPSRVPSVAPDRARRIAAKDGFDGLADLVAARLVAGLFPVDRGRLALAGDPPLPGLVRTRYRQTAGHYGVVLGHTFDSRSVPAANDRLAEGLSEQVERDLRREFETTAAAAGRLDLGTVRIVVRTWST